MNQECLYDCESEENTTEEKESSEENLPCNRIFLNFTREFRHSAKDNYNTCKVKDLFKYLAVRQDLQEMKVSGWLEEEKAEENCESEDVGEEEVLESYYGEKSPGRGKGQRFVMSRDFWYRKLNTLKAQKLDEAALEAKDLPPDTHEKEGKCARLTKGHKIFASEVPEKRGQVLREMDEFDRTVAKPVEKELKKRFINVYDNQKQLKGSCNPHPPGGD